MELTGTVELAGESPADPPAPHRLRAPLPPQWQLPGSSAHGARAWLEHARLRVCTGGTKLHGDAAADDLPSDHVAAESAEDRAAASVPEGSNVDPGVAGVSASGRRVASGVLVLAGGGGGGLVHGRVLVAHGVPFVSGLGVLLGEDWGCAPAFSLPPPEGCGPQIGTPPSPPAPPVPEWPGAPPEFCKQNCGMAKRGRKPKHGRVAGVLAFAFRVSKDERARAEAAAAEVRLTPNDFARRALLLAIDGIPLPKPRRKRGRPPGAGMPSGPAAAPARAPKPPAAPTGGGSLWLRDEWSELHLPDPAISVNGIEGE